MSLSNIQTELKELRNKVRLLKESNKSENESSKNVQKLLIWEKNLLNKKMCSNSNITKNKNEWETSGLISEEEALIVADCYRKFTELVKKHVKEKKNHVKKNKVQYSNTVNLSSSNYDVDLRNTPSLVNECNRNNSHKTKKCGNLTTSECDVENFNLQSNFKEKINKTVKNKSLDSSSACLKLTMHKYSNELEVPIKETNMNIETLTDDAFLKHVTHSREKETKSKSLAKETVQNKNTKICYETFNVSDKMKQHPSMNTTNQEIFEQMKKHPEIKQKATKDSDIVYLNTVNVSPSIITLEDINENSKQVINNSERINSTNFIKSNALQSVSDNSNSVSLSRNKGKFVSPSQYTKEMSENLQGNGNWLSAGNKKTNDCLIDLSSEEDEPETIVSVWDFSEEPVDFTVPDLHIKENTEVFHESKILLYNSKGIVINKGKWSKRETAFLIRNYNDFVDRFGINDSRLLLGIGRQNSNNYENGNVRKFLKAKHFFVRLGKDINHRALYDIYKKARQMFDPLRFKSENGLNNIPFLLQLQKKYGNKWELIAKKFGRSARYCELLYRENKKCYVKGKWSDEEIKNLIYAIKNVSNSSNVLSRNLKNLSWTKITELVKTRSASQCRNQWILLRKRKKKGYIKGKWET